jgi:hypothetical protein
MATRKGRETRAGSAANGVPTRDLDTDGMTWTRGASTNSTRVQTNRDHHLDRTTAGHQRRVEDDVARDQRRTWRCQAAIDLVQNAARGGA